MPVNIAQIVTGALKPISELVDSLHTSKEEKAVEYIMILVHLSLLIVFSVAILQALFTIMTMIPILAIHSF